MSTDISDVYLTTGRHRNSGRVAIGEHVLSWAAKRSDKVITMPVKEIIDMKWCRIDELCQLTVETKENGTVTLYGFKEQVFELFSKFAESNRIAIQQIRYATSGWNWGDCTVQDGNICFQQKDDIVFEIPLTDAAQASRQGKSEVSIEFHQDDTAPPDEDCLVDMRLYVPPLGLDIDDGNEAHRQELAVTRFHEAIRDQLVSTGLQDESISTFSEVLFISPRGRYEIEMFGSYLTLHGKTFTYKVLYKSVSQLLMLENPDKVVFVIGLDPAIRQGGTMYPYLLLSFDPEDEIELHPNLSAEVINEKYKGKLATKMEGPVHEVVGRVFHALTKRKIVISGSFRSAQGDKAVRCSLKANDGYLHPLERCFFFVNKPVTYLRYDDIASMEFARVDAKSKTFDLVVTKRQAATFAFTQISRDEYNPLLEFLRSKSIPILNLADEAAEADAGDIRISMSGRKIRQNMQADLGDEMVYDEDEDDESFRAESEEEISDEYSSRSQASDDEHIEASDAEIDEIVCIWFCFEGWC